jgi:hypothetical protein
MLSIISFIGTKSELNGKIPIECVQLQLKLFIDIIISASSKLIGGTPP